MDDQFDKELNNRIRDTFDNFDDGHADEGWLLLREKYPEKAKRRPAAWLWWSSVAAVLLLLVGILWFKQTPVKKQNQIVNNQKPDKETPKAARAKEDSNVAGNIKADSVIHSLHKQNFANSTAALKPALKNPVRKTGQAALTTLSPQKQAGITRNSAPENKATPDNLAIANQPKAQDHNITAAVKADHIVKADTGTKSSATALVSGVKPAGIDMLAEQKKANKTLFANDEVQEDKKSERTDKAVRFGVYAATYFNYAKGSNNQLNLGAGVSSDIKLSKNLNLSTGVAIAQNTLSYANQTPVNSPQLNAMTSKVGNFSAAAVSESFYSAAIPTVKNYNASLVGLDVPINLKYEFDPEKSGTYVSLGLSSGTFINETYTYSYNQTAPFSANSTQVADQSTHESFNSFYFAKTLNFSFGTGYSLGRNKLIIEPFLKYPLDGLGSEQLKFGAGGINLKFNFQAKK